MTILVKTVGISHVIPKNSNRFIQILKQMLLKFV